MIKATVQLQDAAEQLYSMYSTLLYSCTYSTTYMYMLHVHVHVHVHVPMCKYMPQTMPQCSELRQMTTDDNGNLTDRTR